MYRFFIYWTILAHKTFSKFVQTKKKSNENFYFGDEFEQEKSNGVIFMKIVILRSEKGRRDDTFLIIWFDLLYTPKNCFCKIHEYGVYGNRKQFFSGLNYCQFQILLFVIVIHFLQRNYFIILLKDTWSFISLKITLSMNFL